MTIHARLAVATHLIHEAGDLAAGYFARRVTLTRKTKGPQDFVSVADREVEALIRTRPAGTVLDTHTHPFDAATFYPTVGEAVRGYLAANAVTWGDWEEGAEP